MSPYQRRTWKPVNGERCQLCREILTPDHVPHTRAQIYAWLWAAGWRWRLLLTVYAMVGSTVLAWAIWVTSRAVR